MSADSDALGEGGGQGERAFSIGRYLARQRALRNISIDELAEITKIPRRSLERLEAGIFDFESDGFARGFVRTVAGALGLDPDEAVMRLLREPPDDVGEAPRFPGLRALTALLFALLGLGVIAAALWGVTAALRSADSDGAELPEIVFRRDVVSEIARENKRQREELAAPSGAAAADAAR